MKPFIITSLLISLLIIAIPPGRAQGLGPTQWTGGELRLLVIPQVPCERHWYKNTIVVSTYVKVGIDGKVKAIEFFAKEALRSDQRYLQFCSSVKEALESWEFRSFLLETQKASLGWSINFIFSRNHEKDRVAALQISSVNEVINCNFSSISISLNSPDQTPAKIENFKFSQNPSPDDLPALD